MPVSLNLTPVHSCLLPVLPMEYSLSLSAHEFPLLLKSSGGFLSGGANEGHF